MTLYTGNNVDDVVRALHHWQILSASGHVPQFSGIHKFGYQGAVSTVEIPVWDLAQAYVWPDTAKVMTVSSGDTSDTAAGTGARTVEIHGLDSEWSAISETVSLNGQTAVSTTNAYLRVNRGIVRSAGASAINAGIVYVGASTVVTGVPAAACVSRLNALENSCRRLNTRESQTAVSKDSPSRAKPV